MESPSLPATNKRDCSVCHAIIPYLCNGPEQVLTSEQTIESKGARLYEESVPAPSHLP
jgi:hypothetical protein